MRKPRAFRIVLAVCLLPAGVAAAMLKQPAKPAVPVAAAAPEGHGDEGAVVEIAKGLEHGAQIVRTILGTLRTGIAVCFAQAENAAAAANGASSK